MTDRVGHLPDAGQPCSDTFLTEPNSLIQETVVSWNSVRGDDPYPTEELKAFAELIVVAFEHDGYPLTDLHQGHVILSISDVGDQLSGAISSLDKMLRLNSRQREKIKFHQREITDQQMTIRRLNTRIAVLSGRGY